MFIACPKTARALVNSEEQEKEKAAKFDRILPLFLRKKSVKVCYAVRPPEKLDLSKQSGFFT